MDKDTAFVIPSRGRANRSNFQSLDFIPYSLRSQTFLFLTEDDEDQREDLYKDLHGDRVEDILVVDTKNLSEKKQRIQEWALSEGFRTVVCVDDDMIFHQREEPWVPGVMTSLSPPLWKQEHLEAMWEHCLNPPDKANTPFLGICERLLNVNLADTRGHKEVSRCVGVAAWDVGFFHDFNIRSDRLETMSDYDAVLQVLTQGYKSSISLEYVWNSTSQAGGGCDIYRTNETYKGAAEGLHMLHPEFVSLIEKKGRTDVKIAWKQAYLAGLEHRAHSPF